MNFSERHISYWARFALLWVVWGLSVFHSLAQTTYDWQTTAPDGNWKQGIANGPRWNPGGLWDEPPSSSATRLRFNNNTFTTMTNNTTAGYIIGQLFFGSSATTSRTINGNSIQFFEFGATWPRIENLSTTLHTINFPFTASSNGGYNMELVASSGNLDFGSLAAINNNGRVIQIYGNNSGIDGTNRAIRLTGIVSGTGALNVSQFGVVKLNANHTYTGQTQIDNGELWIESSGNIAGGSSIFVGNGGQLTNTAKLWLSSSAGGTTFSNAFTVNDGNANTRYAGGLNTSGTHTFSGNITNGSTTGGLNLSALNGGGATTFSGVVSGGGAVITEGSGTLILSGSSQNSWTNTLTANGTLLVLNKSADTRAIGTGNLTIAAGATVRTDANNQLGTGTPSLITINGNGVFNLNNTNQKIALASASSTSSVTLGSGTLNIDNTGTDTYAGVISGTGALIKTNSGVQVLTNTGNGYTGTTTVTSGELRLNPAANTSFASQVVLNGGTLGTTGIIAGRTWTSSSTLNVSAKSTIALAPTTNHTIIFANSSAVTWTSGKILTITGWSGTYNGTSNGTTGKIFFGSSAAGLTTAQLAQIYFYNGTNSYTATILGTGEVVPTATIAMFWGGTASENWVSGAKWSLADGGPYTSSWTNGRAAIFNVASSSITVTSTGPQIASITSFEDVTTTYTSGTITTGGTQMPIFVAFGKTFNFSGTLISTAAGSGIIKNCQGTYFSSQGNAFNGGFTLNDGVVGLGSTLTLGGSNNTLNINGGTIAANGTITLVSGRFSVVNINGDFTFGNSTYPNNISIADPVSLGSSVTRAVTLGSTGAFSLTGVISGTSSNLILAATAAGTLSLGGANTYGGSTSINGGTLKPTVSSALPSTTALVFANTSGAILDLSTSALTPTVASLSGGGTTGGNISFGAPGIAEILTIGDASNTTYSGLISGNGAIVKVGAGTLTLGHTANTYTGTTTVTVGELRLNPSTTTATFASQIILNGGKLSTIGIASTTIMTASNASSLGMAASSSIDLGSNVHSLKFAANPAAWTGTLTINGWTGTAGASGTAGKIFFGSASGTLTSTQLAQISFTGFGTATLLATGELVPSAAVTYAWNGSSNSLWGNPLNWTPNGTPGTIDQITISTTVPNTLIILDTRSITNITIDGTGRFDLSSTAVLNVYGSFTSTSTALIPFYADCASTVNFSSSSSQTIPALSFGNLNATGGSRVLASSGTIKICGSFTPGAGTFTTTGSTVSFNGTTAQTVPSFTTSPAADGYKGLTVENITATATAGSTLTVSGALIISSNARLDMGSNTLTLSGSTSTVNGYLRTAGTITGATTTSLTFVSTGTYEHNFATTAGTIPTATWNTGSTCAIIGYTSFAGSANTSMNQVFSNFTWNCSSQSATCNIQFNNITPPVVNGTFSILNTNGQILRLASSTSYTLNVSSLAISSNTANTILNLADAAATATVNITSGAFSLTQPSNTAQLTHSSSGSSTINFTGSSAQTITNSGTINGTVNFRCNNPNGISITGSLPINSGATFYRTQGSVTGTISYNSSAFLSYDPTGSTALTTATAEWPATGLTNVIINSTSSAAVTLHAARDIPSPGVITFTAGRLVLGNFDLTVQNNATTSVTSAGGYAETNGTGALVRTILSGNGLNNYLFPVGNVGYSPASFAFTGNSVPLRQLGVRAVAGLHPNMAPNPTVYLSRYWVTTLSDATGTYSYTPTYTFIDPTPTDVNGSPTSNLRLSRYISGSTWSNVSTAATTAPNLVGSALTESTGNLQNGNWTGRASKTTITYTWVGATGGDWSTASNWTSVSGPGVPTTGDAVIFNHADTRSVQGVLTGISLTSMLFSNGGTTSFFTASAGTLNIGGGSNPQLSIAANTNLLIDGTNSISLALLSGNYGSIYGNVGLQAPSGSVAHSLLPSAVASSIVFQTGSYFSSGKVASTNYTGNPFGSSGTNDAVEFKTGAIFEQFDGGSPFGSLSSDRIVKFNTGSLYKYSYVQAAQTPSISARTFANFEYNASGTRTSSLASNSFTMDNLTVTQGTWTIDNTFSANNIINGNVSIASGASLTLNPTNPGTYSLSSTTLTQTISGAGSLTVGANAILNVTNTFTGGVSLQKNLTDNGTINVSGILNIKDENIISGTGTFTLNSGATLGIGSANGISTSGASGNVQTTTRTYNAAANYTYNGGLNQVTGNGLPTSHTGALTIANTGASGSNTVTLSTTGSTGSNLVLSSGLYAIGSGQTYNIASGGSVNATSGDFVSGSGGGILNFVNSGSFSGSCSPYNVYLSSTSGNTGVNFGSGTVTIQAGGSLRINSGGFVNTNAPFYADNSSLVYNTGNNFTAASEWYANFTSGRGIPYDVQVGVNGVNNSVLDFGSNTLFRNCKNNFTIGASAGGSGYGFILSSNSGGDLKLGGNWQKNTNGNFTHNNRAVYFVGSGTTQTITASAGETFGYFIVDNPNGTVQLSAGTTVTVNGSIGGNVMQLSQGNIDLNGQTLNLGGAGGYLNVVTAQRKVTSTATANFNIIGSKEITSNSGGSLLFDNLVYVNISDGVNFGASVTTINARLQINGGGYADINAPIYGPNGILIYNNNGVYNRRVEWSGSEGNPGFPNDVIIQNNTTLIAGGALVSGTGEFVSRVFGARRDVTIENGSTLQMNGSGYDMTVPLEIGRDLVINGSLIGSNAVGGDIYLTRNWTRNSGGTYSHNDRTLRLQNASNSVITAPGAGETFGYLRVYKSSPANTVTCAAPVFVQNDLELNTGIVITTATNLLTVNSANASAVIGGSSSSYISGPLRRYTSASVAGTYTFPVGDISSSGFKPIKLTTINSLSASTYFTAQYNYAAPPTVGSDAFFTNLLGIQKNEYWQLDRSSGATTTGKVTLTYSDPGNSNWRDVNGAAIAPCTTCNVAIVKRSSSTGSGNWDFTSGPVNFADAANPPEARFYTDAGDIVTRELTSFSPIAFGFAYNIILPVKLISFTGRLQGGDGRLSWQVANVPDLKNFELQHSRDGRSFSRLADIASSGTDKYQYTHASLKQEANFYRLKVNDKNGSSFFSQVVVLTPGGLKTEIIGLKNNPVFHDLTTLVTSATKQQVSAEIRDASGRLITRQSTTLMAGQNQWQMNAGIMPSPGLYFISIQTADGAKATLKFLKQ